MVLYMRAKIQQKGRNGKRYGLFRAYWRGYFNVLLLSLGWVPDLGLNVFIFSPIAGFCFLKSGCPRYFTPLCICTLRTWHDSMGQVRQLATPNKNKQRIRLRNGFMAQR
jgi:cell division protein FtsW (lipid II flippase)